MENDSSTEESRLIERYKFTISYNGTAFFGFQRQGAVRTVQLELENALRKLGWKEESITGAGRTDSGVHAAGQVVSAAMEWHHGEEQLRAALNAALPHDLAVLKDRLATANGKHRDWKSRNASRLKDVDADAEVIELRRRIIELGGRL